VPAAAIVAFATLAAVLVVMAGEALLSAYNAATLRARGAVEPPDDVHGVMQWAYPGGFIAMSIEGALSGPSPPWALVTGLVVFGLAKALKAWAIATLGWRWTYRVLVPASAPLVATGPYRLVNHPNYLAVGGEIVGAALLVCAPITGTAFLAGFGMLLRKRIAVEDRELGRLKDDVIG
jgi:methyltransferase